METKGEVNPPPREMPAFLKNMMKANDNIICSAKGADVHKASIAFLLGQRLRIPIFQRRYCWGKDQWDTLLNDALLVADGMKEKHAFGRITCVRLNAIDSRLSVIDGQQRNTTCSLLLSAIRDVALEQHSEDPACRELASTLDSVLFPDTAAFEAWLSQSCKSRQIDEGIALEFAALIPTYCDRASYFAAILPPRAGVGESQGEWRRPWEAKSHFVDRLRAFSADRLLSLADAVLYKLEWLFFPISVNDGHQDGTEDLQVIFERLAARDASMSRTKPFSCKPSRAGECASMGAADFIRNLLLGSFQREADAIEMYKIHWLQIEQLAAAASVKSRSSNIAEILEAMINKFLKLQPEFLARPSAMQPVLVGGDLYLRFRQWFTAALAAASSVHPGDESPADALERKTVALLSRLQTFAVDYFANGGGINESSLPEMASVLEKWRCSQCLFPNMATATVCTACCLPRP